MPSDPPRAARTRPRPPAPRAARRSGAAAAALLAALAVASQATASNTQAGGDMVVINPGGGRLPDGSDGMQTVLNGSRGYAPAGVSADVPVDGSDQQFFGGTGQWLFSGRGPVLVVGGTPVGEAGAARPSSGVPGWDAISVLSTAGSAVRVAPGGTALPATPTGSGAATIRHTATIGGRAYRVDRTVTYTHPNPHHTDTLTVTVPAGNAAPVRLYLGGDAAPGGTDGGTGGIAQVPRRSLFEVGAGSFHLAQHEVPGLPAFAHHHVGSYFGQYGALLGGGDLSDTVDATSHDAAMLVQWDIPSAPGTYTVGVVTEVGPIGAIIRAGFATASAAPGEHATLELRVDNTASGGAGGLGATVPLPAGLTVAGTPSSGCAGVVTAGPGEDEVALAGISVAARTACTVSVPVTAATAGTYTLDQTAITTSGGLGAGFGSTALAVAAPGAPAPGPPAPAAPAAPARLLAPMSVTPGRSAATVAARLSLPGEGRYTFVFYDRATGAPLVQARGGRLGGRTLTRPTRAWSVTGVRAGAPVVLRARLAARRGTRIGLRVERRAPDGTRTVVRLGRTGPIG